MTERQRRFAEKYSHDPNATKAATAAGYSQKTAYSAGQRLLKNVEVLKYIRELWDAEASVKLISAMQVKAYLSGVVQDENETTANRLRASDMLLKAAGEYLHIRPDPDSQWNLVAGENCGEDVVIYLPEIAKVENLEMPDEEEDIL